MNCDWLAAIHRRDRKKAIPRAAVHALIGLALSVKNKNSLVRASIKRIGESVSQGYSTTQRGLKWLREHGIVSVIDEVSVDNNPQHSCYVLDVNPSFLGSEEQEDSSVSRDEYAVKRFKASLKRLLTELPKDKVGEAIEETKALLKEISVCQNDRAKIGEEEVSVCKKCIAKKEEEEVSVCQNDRAKIGEEDFSVCQNEQPVKMTDNNTTILEGDNNYGYYTQGVWGTADGFSPSLPSPSSPTNKQTRTTSPSRVSPKHSPHVTGDGAEWYALLDGDGDGFVPPPPSSKYPLPEEGDPPF